jgi:hypothetical protein
VIVAPEGYELVKGNLNEGGQKEGAQVLLAIRRQPNGSPVTHLTLINEEAGQAPDGFTKLPTDLNFQVRSFHLYRIIILEHG